jgi:hypothetical protein
VPVGIDRVAISADGRTAAVTDGSRVVTLPLPASAPTRIVAVDLNDSGVVTRTVDSVLLTVGLAGLMPFTLFWFWAGPGRWSRRHSEAHEW